MEKDAQGCPLSLSALLCGFLTVSVPASAPVYCSQLSRSCHSSAQNSPVASISLQGKAKALYGPSPSPSSRCSDVPDTISLPISSPQRMHIHTHARAHTHTQLRLHGTAHSSWNPPDTLLSQPSPFICCFLLCASQTLAWLTLFLPQVFSSNVAFSVMPYLNTLFPNSPNSLSSLHFI